MSYANTTTVAVEKTQAEIETLLRTHGATRFVRGWDGVQALLSFELQGRQIRFIVPLPDPEQFKRNGRGHWRTPDQVRSFTEQAQRSRWRAFLLVLRAKLEAIESGIVTFEDEFLAQTVMPNGRTVGEWARVQIDRAITAGEMPPMLPAFSGNGR